VLERSPPTARQEPPESRQLGRRGLSTLYRQFRQFRKNYGTRALLRRALAPAARSLLRKQSKPSDTDRAVARLWGGYSVYARHDLQRIIGTPSHAKAERARASWELARWLAFQGEAEATLACLSQVSALDDSGRLAKGRLLLEVRTLRELGRRHEAEAMAFEALASSGDETDLQLMTANTLIGDDTKEERRLALLNRIYEKQGLQAIRKIDAARGLALDNITAADPGAIVSDSGPTVSVIVPAYNAASTIGYALRSLREQTWRALQIIVVDDASSDDTVAVATEAAEADDRVRVVRLEQNGGAYVASNKGLEYATGEYVTTHGADDWSHPQKIELQVRAFDGDFVATETYLVRATEDLEFTGPWRAGQTLLQPNISSFMLRTELMHEMGGWDPVRTTADTEFVRRLAAKLGYPGVRLVHKEVPMSFALDAETTLTHHPATHIRGMYFGAIKDYGSAYSRWHASVGKSGDFGIDPDPDAPRRFPAPTRMLSRREPLRRYDAILIGDFAADGEGLDLALGQMESLTLAGNRVGIFHWPRYETAPCKVSGRVCALIDRFEVELLTPDLATEADELVIYSPGALQHRLDRVPRIEYRRMRVVVDDVPEIGEDEANDQYDPAAVRRNLEACFGTEGEWCPTSPWVRERMTADSRFPAPRELVRTRGDR
jgi:glycosyltransferase involved in cell wall biosynthesis